MCSSSSSRGVGANRFLRSLPHPQEGLVSSDMSLSSDVRAWNPFNDMTPFSQMSEDHIFGAEFDKIRRGSQSSKCGGGGGGVCV